MPSAYQQTKQYPQVEKSAKVKWSGYIFTFGEINSWQVGGIQIFFEQFQTLKLGKEMLNAANICLFEIKHIKCKYKDTSFDAIFQHN